MRGWSKTRSRAVDRYGAGEGMRLRRLVQGILDRTPYRVERRYPVDLGPDTIEIMRAVAPYTMVSPARLAETIRATEYAIHAGIPGAFCECGVWRGGTMMAVAMTLLRHGVDDRDLFLFDTFEGMPEPTDRDRTWGGIPARAEWQRSREGESNAWCRAPVEDVRAVLEASGYDPSRVQLVKGKVEDTLPASAPDELSLVRLDTDFYESTRHELVHLFPRLAPGGVLILDDYGVWDGVRDAADEYFAECNLQLFLSRTDNAGRLAIKPPGGPSGES